TAGMAIPIVLACDLRFASDQASFTTAFSQRGLIAEWGVSWLLPRVVGTAHALDLLFSARKIDAIEAERIGLVNRVLPQGDLLPFVRRYVENMAAHCSPASLDHEASGVAGLDPRARPGRARGDPAHGGELPAAGLRRGRPVVPREAPAALRAP